MNSTRPNGTLRVPAPGSSGLLMTSTSSVWPFGIVFDHDLQRVQHAHHARRAQVEIFADGVLEVRDVDDVLALGDADAVAEVADGFRRVAAPPQARERGHARVVPAADVPAFDQLEQLALAHHRVAEIQPRELDLPRVIDAERVEIPVVERPMVFVFERAERVRDALDGIGLAVRPVVHRIDAPGVAGALMRGLADPVHDRIAQVDVAGRHVDLGAQHARAVRELAGAHAPEQVEIFLDGSIAIRALAARLGERAAVLAHLVGGQAVDVGLARLDELLGPLVELLEVVGRVKQVLAPVEAEPADVPHDLVGVLLRLFHRVGVVEAQVAAAAEFLRDAEIDADGFGVADVQAAVRLRRKAGDHTPPFLPEITSCETISRMKSRGAASGPLSALGVSMSRSF